MVVDEIRSEKNHWKPSTKHLSTQSLRFEASISSISSSDQRNPQKNANFEDFRKIVAILKSSLQFAATRRYRSSLGSPGGSGGSWANWINCLFSISRIVACLADKRGAGEIFNIPKQVFARWTLSSDFARKFQISELKSEPYTKFLVSMFTHNVLKVSPTHLVDDSGPAANCVAQKCSLVSFCLGTPCAYSGQRHASISNRSGLCLRKHYLWHNPIMLRCVDAISELICQRTQVFVSAVRISSHNFRNSNARIHYQIRMCSPNSNVLEFIT